jgi:hypothetical protein
MPEWFICAITGTENARESVTKAEVNLVFMKCPLWNKSKGYALTGVRSLRNHPLQQADHQITFLLSDICLQCGKAE